MGIGRKEKIITARRRSRRYEKNQAGASRQGEVFGQAAGELSGRKTRKKRKSKKKTSEIFERYKMALGKKGDQFKRRAKKKISDKRDATESNISSAKGRYGDIKSRVKNKVSGAVASGKSNVKKKVRSLEKKASRGVDYLIDVAIEGPSGAAKIKRKAKRAKEKVQDDKRMANKKKLKLREDRRKVETRRAKEKAAKKRREKRGGMNKENVVFELKKLRKKYSL